MLVRRRRWVPEPSSVINPSHPSSQGLLAAVLPGHNVLRDYTNRYTVGRIGAGGGPTEGTPVGSAVGSFASASYQTIGQTGSSIVAGLSQFSIVAGLVVLTAGAAASSRAPYCERGTAGVQICKLEFNTTTGGWGGATLGLTYRDNSSTLINVGSTTTIDDGKFHLAVLRRLSATSFDLYLDGDEEATYSNGSMTANFTPNATHVNSIGRDVVATGAPFTGAVTNLYLYNRALGPSEIAELYEDPFGIFA